MTWLLEETHKFARQQKIKTVLDANILDTQTFSNI